MFYMKYIFLVLLVKCANGSRRNNDAIQTELPTFRDTVKFGIATSAYQTEGAWNVSGKGVSIWDTHTHNKSEYIIDGSNADITTNSYYYYKTDVQMIKSIGFEYYRFSVSWTRILPTGFTNKINQDGIDFYNNFINELLDNGIEPMLTIYHWDLPQTIQDLGGWANPLIEYWFADYADVLFKNFGDRIKLWSTVNEPYEICRYGYGDVDLFHLAPGVIAMDGFANYLCAYSLLKAHARAYHIYNDNYKADQGGKIGILIDVPSYTPFSDSEEDVTTAELFKSYNYGLYADPIFSESGDFPKSVSDIIEMNSLNEGYQRSRLPKFTEEEINYIKGTSDFFGLNHYQTITVKHSNEYTNNNDIPGETTDVTGWDIAGDGGSEIQTWGIRHSLNDINDRYNNPEIIIGEIGSTSDIGLNDVQRVEYFISLLGEIYKAIEYDNINVTKITFWSLMDNFEWTYGYYLKFGLFYVDFDDESRKRTPRRSALTVKEIIRTRTVDPDYVPDGF